MKTTELLLPTTREIPLQSVPHDGPRNSWACRMCAVLAGAVVILLFPKSQYLRYAGQAHETQDHTSSPSFMVKEKITRGKSIHIIGERHSGTNMIMSHLKHCFSDAGVFVNPGYTRWKHWFQFEDELNMFHDIYVLSIVRNPFDWVESMRANPSNSPLHMNLGWEEFVTKPWTMPRYGRDLGAKNTSSCHQGFTYLESIPCIEQDRLPNSDIHPKYELRLDKSGLPYESIVDLRRDKLLNHLGVGNFAGVSDYKMIRFEDMILNGTASILAHYEKVLGVKSNCHPKEPTKLRSKSLPEDYIKWIRDHVDWDVEKLVGYRKEDFLA